MEKASAESVFSHNVLEGDPTRRRRLMLSCSACVIALAAVTTACDFDPRRADAAPQSANSGATRAAREPLAQEQTTDLAALLAQYKGAGAKETEAASVFLREADEYAARRRWGAAGKRYIESVMHKPSVAGLVGAGDALAQMERSGDEERDATSAKVAGFRDALRYYRVALDFDARLDARLDPEARARVDETINCLEGFIEAPRASGACLPARLASSGEARP